MRLSSWIGDLHGFGSEGIRAGWGLLGVVRPDISDKAYGYSTHISILNIVVDRIFLTVAKTKQYF